MFQGFSQGAVDFLWSIRFNNERSWFLAHKEEYLTLVDRPMRELGDQVHQAMEELCPELGLNLHVSRIYRDARRLYGRGPYKDHLWLSLRHENEAWASRPVFYFEIMPEGYSYGMGFYSATAQTMERFYQHRAQVDAGEGGFLTTGLRALDQMLGGGLLNSGLYVLAARPGMGKTALALQIADHMAQNHGGVLYISLEMDLEQIAARRLARLIRMPVHRLLMDRLDEQTCARMAQAAGQLSQLPLYLNRQSWAGVDQVEQLARQVPGLRCIVIDYFGLLRPAEGKGSRYEAMTQISGALKALARSRGVPVLCLAQLNRELTQRRDCRPKLSDLRDTGALEQDADGVILLHREDYYQDGPAPDPCLLDLILAKNRHGPTGECQMAFYLAQGRAAPTMVRRGVEG